MAVAYWNLVLAGRFKFLDLWNRFLLVSNYTTGFLTLYCTEYELKWIFWLLRNILAT